MVRYLKYIVLIFGGIGLIALSFFYLQNQHDISMALEYKNKIDYHDLTQKCPPSKGDISPCLYPVFEDYLKNVSLTGTSIGLKMLFNVVEKEKDIKKVENVQKEV